MRRNSTGFTLIELIAVVAIIGILAAIAVPQYGQYAKRAKFTQVISATTAVKSAVHVCVQDLNDLSGCDGGANGVPSDLSGGTDLVASVTTSDGRITAVSGAKLDDKTYVLSPIYTLTENKLVWMATGTCLAARYC